MKEQQMPKAIQGLVNNAADKKSDCHTSVEAETSDKLKGEKTFVKDFEPMPNLSAYDGDDKKLSGEDKSFVKDFEPRPNVSAYDNGAGLKGEKPFDEDFEPRPNASVYQN